MITIRIRKAIIAIARTHRNDYCSSVASQLLNATDSLVTLLLPHGLSSEVAVSKAGPFRQAIGTPGLTPRILDGGVGRRSCKNTFDIFIKLISTLDPFRGCFDTGSVGSSCALFLCGNSNNTMSVQYRNVT